ncbi:MAG: imidazole glycerol phosphate synthase subunit HisH [Chitinophagaceae bacterium]
MLAIINYGIGNLASIYNMLRKAGIPAEITSDKETIAKAQKIVLPGVGAFDYCMQQFNASGLRELVTHRAFNEQVPVLGVCVGSQMLMESSEEGNEPGLGWLPGKVVKFKKDSMPGEYKIPHMGWTDVQPASGNELYAGIDEPRFYFVHSYHIQTSPELVTATADYGYSFTASVGKGHIQGVQFHPEKSHRFGLQLYTNFANNF